MNWPLRNGLGGNFIFPSLFSTVSTKKQWCDERVPEIQVVGVWPAFAKQLNYSLEHRAEVESIVDTVMQA